MAGVHYFNGILFLLHTTDINLQIDSQHIRSVHKRIVYICVFLYLERFVRFVHQQFDHSDEMH